MSTEAVDVDRCLQKFSGSCASTCTAIPCAALGKRAYVALDTLFSRKDEHYPKSIFCIINKIQKLLDRVSTNFGLG